MKKLFLLQIMLAVLLFIGCDDAQPPDSSDISSPSEILQEVSEASEEKDSIDHTEIYSFLNSEYCVTAARSSFETEYVYNYYLIDGKVAGAVFSATFSNERDAENFYERITEDYPDASIKDMTVTVYSENDEDFYYGYTLEKLKFVLEKADYEVTANFDENDFYDESEDISEE